MSSVLGSGDGHQGFPKICGDPGNVLSANDLFRLCVTQIYLWLDM